MISAAIVGLGWWGKTLVEAADDSDAIRFVAGATRTVTPEIEAFAKKHGFATRCRIMRRCSPIRVWTPWFLRRRIRCMARRSLPPRRPSKHIYLRKAVHADQAGSGRRGRRRAQSRGHARAWLQPPASSRNDQTARHDPRGRARHRAPRRIDHDLSQCAVHQSQPLARRQDRDAARRIDADGRACRRRHDRPVRADRSCFRAEFSPRRADRCRRHHLDPVSHEGGHVGLSRHHDHDRARFQLSRCSVQKAGCGSKASLMLPALRRRSGARGYSAPASSSRSRARPRTWQAETMDISRAALEAFAKAAEGGPALSDPIRPDDPRRCRHRSHRPRGGVRKRSSTSIKAKQQEIKHGSRQRPRPSDLFDARASRRQLGAIV